MLDEIGELALTHQTKLLRALDAREIVPVGGTRSVRVGAPVIAATNVELLAETADEFLRADLHARLAGSVIHMPPLGERRGDVLALARSFLAQEPGGRRLSTHAAERLLLHPWPRNVRELLSTMRRVSLHIVGDRAKITRAASTPFLIPW